MAKQNGFTRGAGTSGAPTSDNVQRQNEAGNVSVTGEKHDQSKAEHVSADSRFGSDIGPEQPTRQNEAGNVPVTGEMHDQTKATTIPASRRW